MATLKADYLAMPVKQSQINASREFWKGWESPKLAELKRDYPNPADNIREKMDTLDHEYSTYFRADRPEVVECLERALETNKATGPDYVETMVTELRKTTGHYNFVFAAKFTHFFVDSSLPIMDKYAEWLLQTQHLNKPQSENRPGRYRTFFEDLATLIRLAGLTNTPTELDPYLWTAGEYWGCWVTGDRKKVNGYLKPIFKDFSENPGSQPVLAALLDRGGVGNGDK